MGFFKAATGTSFSLLVLVMTPARAEPSLHPTHVDVMESCHKGLVVWMPYKNNAKYGMVGTPQVKVFDGTGRLRFIGNALEAIQWAKAGQPSTPIPQDVVVRDAASEARATHVGVPSTGHGWVTFYVSKPCPPCGTQLATFRLDAMPKLGAGTVLSVFELN